MRYCLQVMLFVAGCTTVMASELRVLREDQPFIREDVLSNPYDRAIRIELLDSTCVCQELHLTQRFLLPGAETTLRMRVENRNYSGLLDRQVILYHNDPELEPLVVPATWQVVPLVSVDLIPPHLASAAERPESGAFRDVYRYLTDTRPGELAQQRKIIRIGCPPETMPDGGLELVEIDNQTALWGFEKRRLDMRTWLLIATGRDEQPAEKRYQESLILRTNQSSKERIELWFETVVRHDAGRGTDPFGHLR